MIDFASAMAAVVQLLSLLKQNLEYLSKSLSSMQDIRRKRIVGLHYAFNRMNTTSVYIFSQWRVELTAKSIHIDEFFMSYSVYELIELNKTYIKYQLYHWVNSELSRFTDNVLLFSLMDGLLTDAIRYDIKRIGICLFFASMSVQPFKN